MLVKKIKAVFNCLSKSESSAWMSVVFPVPGSPVMTIMPFRSRIPESMADNASEWVGSDRGILGPAKD